MGVPQNGWFIMEILLRWIIWRYPHFRKPPYLLLCVTSLPWFTWYIRKFPSEECKFCVTVANPQSEDSPLIAVSEEFETMTGFSRHEIPWCQLPIPKPRSGHESTGRSGQPKQLRDKLRQGRESGDMSRRKWIKMMRLSGFTDLLL